MKEVTADVGKKSFDENDDVFFLDVRKVQEYRKGHIKGSIHIPLDELTNVVTNVFHDKESKIYIYCSSGSRSNVAMGYLEEMGYTNIFSMTGGLLAWRSKNYPLVVE